MGCQRVGHASSVFRDLGKNAAALNLETVYRMVSCVGVGGLLVMEVNLCWFR